MVYEIKGGEADMDNFINKMLIYCPNIEIKIISKSKHLCRFSVNTKDANILNACVNIFGDIYNLSYNVSN